MANRNTALIDEGAFDYIVTGAGSAGCVLAARLSESGRHSVLLLEAGGRDTNPWIHIPMGQAKLFARPSVNWMYESEPEPELGGRTSFQPRGKVLGGTSAINGMVYIRGNPADYDEWRQRGCLGWDYDSVLPYFKKSEDQERGANEYHGAGGPLRVSDQPIKWELAQAVIDAGVEAGLPFNEDFNGAQHDGVGWFQTTTKDRRRHSTASAFLTPNLGRVNLRVKTRALATRVVIQNGKATGVEFQTGAGRHIARAKGEVIVAGGAFNSPHLLQLSGLGPGDLLRGCGIEVIRDMPGVGANLLDHFYVRNVFRCPKPITLNDYSRSWPWKIKSAFQYAFFRSGVLSGHGLYCGAFARSDDRLDRPDIQINLNAGSTLARTASGLVTHPFSGFSLNAIHLRPDSRGTVHLKSPDPNTHPQIRFNFLQTQNDIRAMTTAQRLVRKIGQQPALAPYVAEEFLPGAKVQTDAEFETDIRERGVSNLHPVGSCRMGTEADAVVDPRLRVHGVGNLRVVDASIMPTIISGNTNAPVIMIAEKASAMILEDAKAA
jgi:choline dehydrogenase